MSLTSGLQYAAAVWRLGKAAYAAEQRVASGVPASPGGGGLLASLPSVEQLDAATAFLKTDPRAAAIIAGARAFAGGDAQKLVAAFKAHDWGTAAHIALTDALTVADKAGVPYAGLALRALPFFEYAAQHPAPVESQAMRKAAGPADNPYDHGTGGAYPTGGIAQ